MAAAVISIAGAYLSAGGFTTAFGYAMALMGAQQIFGTKQKIEGPKLSSLAVQMSEPGQTIPIFYGSPRTAGNIIWSQKIKPHRHTEESGKGGGGTEYTTWTYTWNGAILLGESCDQVEEIWADNKKIYDYNGGTQKGYTLAYDAGTGAWTSTGLRIYTGTDTQLPDSLIESVEGVGVTPAFRGRTYLVFENFNLTPFGGRIPTFTARVRRDVTAVDEIAADMLERVGVESADVDFAALEDYTLSAMIINQRDECRRYLENIQSAFYCRFIEFDYKMQAISMVGNDSIATLSGSDVAFVEYGSEGQPTDAVTEQPRAMPYRVDLSYIDNVRDGNPNTQSFARQVVETRHAEEMTLPMAFNGAQARQICQTTLLSRWAERTAYSLSLGSQFLYLVPGDVITVPTRTGNVDVRIEEAVKQLFGPMMVKAVRHDASVYAVPLMPDPSDNLPPSEVPDYPLPRYVMVDCHTIRDDDTTTPGFYIGMGIPQGQRWMGAAITGATIVAGDYTQQQNRRVNIQAQATIGVASSVLPDGSPYEWDTTTELLVDIRGGPGGGALFSTTDENVMAGPANAMLVGMEIIQFVNAEYIGPVGDNGQRYKLTRLLRGRVGTEPYCGTHAGTENIMLLDDAVYRVRVQDWSIGQEKRFNIIWGYGESSILGWGGTTYNDFTVNGWSLKPFAVGGLRSMPQGNGDVVIEWFKRTRHSEQYYATGRGPTDSVPPDLDEFEYEIWDTEGGNLLRSGTAEDEFITYTAAQIAADGLDDTDTVFVKVWRMSSVSSPAAEGGQGYVATETVALGAS